VQDIEIVVENDHIERLTSASPLVALSELIWNAYDVDSKVVRVEFDAGKVTKLGHIRVIDDGTGIPFEKAATFFQSLGGSWKKQTIRTPGGRLIHGKKGQGRFKAFALGENVTWVSESSGKGFSISGSKSNLKRFHVTDVIATATSGCRVEIDDVLRDFKIRSASDPGRAASTFDRSIDTQVSRLRKKLEADPADPKIIQTVWGGGYLFAPAVSQQ
jgi:hypothetical protein